MRSGLHRAWQSARTSETSASVAGARSRARVIRRPSARCGRDARRQYQAIVVAVRHEQAAVHAADGYPIRGHYWRHRGGEHLLVALIACYVLAIGIWPLLRLFSEALNPAVDGLDPDHGRRLVAEGGEQLRRWFLLLSSFRLGDDNDWNAAAVAAVTLVALLVAAAIMLLAVRVSARNREREGALS